MYDVEQHWREVWSQTDGHDRSWFQDRATTSLRLVTRFTEPDARVVDVGGGASPLVDALLDRGHPRPVVVDIAHEALDHSRQRLGDRAREVDWVVADVRALDLGHRVDLWHDRAVLHFLIDPADQRAYARAMDQHVAPGGHVVLGTFAPDGPERCSGLPVQRHDPASLADVLGEAYELVHDEREDHTTPSGTAQAFTWAVFRRTITSG